MAAREHDDAEELLMELQHDLGKYLRMPLSFLPKDASVVDVRAALHKALFATKATAKGTLSARELWKQFEGEAPATVRELAAFPALRSAVEKALLWERVATDANATIDRVAVEGDLGAVTPAIRAVLAELGQR